jgi:hypothetical protein
MYNTPKAITTPQKPAMLKQTAAMIGKHNTPITRKATERKEAKKHITEPIPKQHDIHPDAKRRKKVRARPAVERQRVAEAAMAIQARALSGSLKHTNCVIEFGEEKKKQKSVERIFQIHEQINRQSNCQGKETQCGVKRVIDQEK